MAISKVILNGEVKIDLSTDNVEACDVRKGKTFHKPDGTVAIGTLVSTGQSGGITEIETAEEMDDILTSDISIDSNIVYKYIGDTTDKYIKNAFYILSEIPEMYDIPSGMDLEEEENEAGGLTIHARYVE